MTSQSPRMMMQMSETVVVYTFLLFWNFWCKSLGRVPSRVENLVFDNVTSTKLQFCSRGFRRKKPFLGSSTKLAEVVQGIAFGACVEVQENIQQRSMMYVLMYVWKGKNTYYRVEVGQNVITPPHPTHPTPKISRHENINTRLASYKRWHQKLI